MFNGKCGFCRKHGHNIGLCSHPDKYVVITQIETELYTFDSRFEIRKYLNTLSPVRIHILASMLNIPSGMPNVLIKNKLTEYYFNNILVRDARIARNRREVEDIRHDYPQYMPLPHSLFRRCMIGIQELGTEICIALAIIKQRVRGEYTPVQPIQQRETHMFLRGWKIIPELSMDIDEPNETRDCPICFEMKLKSDYVVPLCKHGVCRSCFINMVDNGSVLKAPLCPMCREVIKMVDVYNIDMYNTIVNKYVCE
jgi:hypothetical protein